MREYTFISKGRAEGVVVDVDLPKKISAISLKKAIAKFSPKELCTMAVIYWTSRKGNESKKVVVKHLGKDNSTPELASATI